jgi:ribosome-interacting GTPase 1
MSCELDLGIEDVVDRCWEELQLMRIYTKRYVPLQYSPKYLDPVSFFYYVRRRLTS